MGSKEKPLPRAQPPGLPSCFLAEQRIYLYLDLQSIKESSGHLFHPLKTQIRGNGAACAVGKQQDQQLRAAVGWG